MRYATPAKGAIIKARQGGLHSMGLTIPDDTLRSAGMSAEEVKQELAVVLFQKERLTLGQASRLAGLNQLRFQRLLASRRIPVHYGVAKFEEDLETLRGMGRL